MIHFEQIREQMKEQYEKDSSRFFVEVTGQTLEEAIDNAAVELGLRRSLIDYEVLQKGASGFFVLNPKEWKIRAYEVHKINKLTTESEDAAGVSTEEQAQEIYQAINDETMVSADSFRTSDEVDIYGE